MEKDQRIQKIGVWIFQFVRLLFHFRKPELLHLELSDWVIDQKPLLVIRWQMRYPYQIAVKEANYSSRQQTGGSILRLPYAATKATIIIRSGWRKTILPFELHKIVVPDELGVVISADSFSMQLPVVRPLKPAYLATTYETGFPRLHIIPFNYPI